MAVSGLRGRAGPRAIDSILISATRYLNCHVITRGRKPRLDLLQICLLLLPLLPFFLLLLFNVVRHRVLVLPLLLLSLLFLLFSFGIICL